MHLPSLRIHQNLTYGPQAVHQNLTYGPQAEQELCVCQDTLVLPGVTSVIAHISYGHTCTRVKGLPSPEKSSPVEVITILIVYIHTVRIKIKL